MEDIIYGKAADVVKQYMAKNTVRFDATVDEAERLRTEFVEKFSPEKLDALCDDELLHALFYTVDNNNDSLCYHLEHNPQMRRTFGSIAGGSSYKFGLFQRHEDSNWVTGASSSSKIISEEKALGIGKKIRDNLVEGCKIIRNSRLETVEDYENLENNLNASLGEFASYAWVHKYFYLIFQDKFVGWYVDEWLTHFLYGLGVSPSTKYYGMNGQLTIIAHKVGLPAVLFKDVCFAMFGGVKRFIRLGSSDSSCHYAERWRSAGVVGIGWPKLGSLLEYLSKGKFDKDKVSMALAQEYNMDNRLASRKAGELRTFYETSQDCIFVVMDGFELKAFVDDLSPYYFDDADNMPHKKNGTWKEYFSPNEKLPEEEGNQTSCFEIKKTKNLLYLYSKYYNLEGLVVENLIASTTVTDLVAKEYDFTITSGKGKNLIVYGTPGCGKSYYVQNTLLKHIGASEENTIRTTFFMDYTNTDFVGQILPKVHKDKSVTYNFNPGPFTIALRKAIEHPEKNIALVIEELNRGNAPSIFGDIFQLLDRKEHYYSEYKITNVNIQDYLNDFFSGKYTFSAIRIPANLYVFATMNTSDQNVFTLDTAFKRRWGYKKIRNDFTDEHPYKDLYIPSLDKDKITWEKFVTGINEFILNHPSTFSSEDKQLGVFFVEADMLCKDDEIAASEKKKAFAYKVLEYLWDDVAKFDRPTWFGSSIKSLDQLIDEYMTKGISVFDDDVFGNKN